MREPEFRSRPTVRYLEGHGSDRTIASAAQVSTTGVDAGYLPPPDVSKVPGLINYLMKHRHGSPFEHNSMTFFIECPIFVAREFMRHRIGWSYNETSGRYRELDPVFWVPNDDRPLIRTTAAARPEFEHGGGALYDSVAEALQIAYHHAWEEYRGMLELRVAGEVARTVLPVGTFTSFYATCNARSLMAFLSLRTSHEDATFRSYPQMEIEQVAQQMEITFAKLFPQTYAAFDKNGRVAP